MASVTLEQIRKSYGSVEVVRAVDLEVEDGSFVTLVGPSGCGKSTTLHIIAGLEHPSSGTVRIGGEAVNRLSPKERDIAMVFQSYALYPHMDVRSNMAFPLENAGIGRTVIDERVRETAAMLGIDHLLR